MLALMVGHRILHKVTGQAGFVTAASSATGWNKGLVTVTLEGSTRSEDWPLTQVRLRQSSEQLAIHGGEFNPPKGFPLHIK
jgi:hypothetical protein|tara:strand:+ start:54 stop:296 length:243 start_codon:yes stop_codon:yes gene_type:complete